MAAFQKGVLPRILLIYRQDIIRRRVDRVKDAGNPDVSRLRSVIYVTISVIIIHRKPEDTCISSLVTLRELFRTQEGFHRIQRILDTEPGPPVISLKDWIDAQLAVARADKGPPIPLHGAAFRLELSCEKIIVGGELLLPAARHIDIVMPDERRDQASRPASVQQPASGP